MDKAVSIAELSLAEKRALLAARLRKKVPATKSLPMSFAQQRLWFLNQVNPESTLYNIVGGVPLRGELNLAALEKAVHELVRRHEVLRTTFARVNEQPMQIIAAASTPSLEVEDLSGLPEERRKAAMLRIFEAEGKTVFDLATGPLFRVKLIKLKPDEQFLFFAVHHIVFDGWSNGVLVSEIITSYHAFSKNEPSPLPELPIQYADFATWQRKRMSGDFLDQELGYWKEQLSGIPASINLPREQIETTPRGGGAELSLMLSSELTRRLLSLTKQEGATAFMLLLAAFQTLLHRYSGQNTVVVGTPISGREQTELQALIGLFVNTLVLRADYDDDPTFRQLLARVKETALGAYAHQSVPFEKVVEELRPKRSLDHSPLFQVVFTFQSIPPDLRVLDQADGFGSEVKSVSAGLDLPLAKFDLTLSVVEMKAGLYCAMQYRSDMFGEGTIRRMLENYRVLLQSIADSPDERMSKLPILSEPERKLLLEVSNHTRNEYPREPEWVEKTRERLPSLTLINHKFPNTGAYVLDRHLELVPIDVTGELYLGADFPNSGTLHKTGDLARRAPDGTLIWLGNASHRRTEIDGFGIDLDELAAVVHGHPSVRNVFVAVQADANLVNRLVMYLVAAENEDETHARAAVWKQLKEALPDELLPSAFVFLDELPVTPKGDVDVQQLPSPYAALSEPEKEFVAPRDTIELQLAVIWQEILGFSPISVTDNFFELGGHSILAIRMMTKARRQLGREIPLAPLFEKGTIEHLARTLRQDTGAIAQSPLVKIQPLGDKRPFVCVHGIGGGVIDYLPLSHALGTTQPFWGVQATGPETERRSVEDIAACYLKALQDEQPAGPYLIGGWSFGGLIAFEMARQLKDKGDEVALLALFDSIAPGFLDASAYPDIADADDPALVVRFIKETMGSDVRETLRGLDSLPPAEQLSRVFEHARQEQFVPPEVELSDFLDWLRGVRNRWLAERDYSPQEYSGDIVLFKARDVSALSAGVQAQLDRDPTYGWGRLSSRDIELYPVPGSHHTMMSAANVSDLAAQLMECIARRLVASPDLISPKGDQYDL